MTLKHDLTRIGKIGLVYLVSLPIAGCEGLGIKKASPESTGNRIGYYAGFNAKSINIVRGFKVSLLDTTNSIYVDGELYEDGERFSRIEYGVASVDGRWGKLTPGSNPPILKYANPDSLLKVHKTLRERG